ISRDLRNRKREINSHLPRQHPVRVILRVNFLCHQREQPHQVYKVAVVGESPEIVFQVLNGLGEGFLLRFGKLDLLCVRAPLNLNVRFFDTATPEQHLKVGLVQAPDTGLPANFPGIRVDASLHQIRFVRVKEYAQSIQFQEEIHCLFIARLAFGDSDLARKIGFEMNSEYVEIGHLSTRVFWSVAERAKVHLLKYHVRHTTPKRRHL
ncbi:MAG: hypothetical protein ACLPT4_10240, partial [Verrucomicrobiia bacterium]